MFLKQRYCTTWLSGNQPDGYSIRLKPLNQFAEFAELIGISRNGPTGEIEGVWVIVLFE